MDEPKKIEISPKPTKPAVLRRNNKNIPKDGEKGWRKVYTDEQKKFFVTKTLTDKITDPYKSIKKIAHEIGIPAETLKDLINKDSKWNDYIKKQKVLFDVQALEVIQKGVARMKEKIGTANLPATTVAVGVLHDKVFGVAPLNQVNVGDKVVKVYYPNFEPPPEEDKK